jgi:hypothetical protein
LDLRGRKWQEAGEDCIKRSFIICAVHKVLFGAQMKEDEIAGTCKMDSYGSG